MTPSTEPRFAALVYRFRWPFSLLMLAAIVTAAVTGGGHVAKFTAQMAGLGDTTNGSGAVPPLVFDPRMDLWFGEEDAAVETYREIERRFVAEDYIMVTYEVPDAELGVFDAASLATIARLTEGFLEVPGVRHVRSLTSNPWIRYGAIPEAPDEQGLLISDLVEGDPRELSEDEIVARMVATLGARRVADKLGEARVRELLGPDADFDDFIGEPLLLGTILDESGTTTAIQIQVLRPRVDADKLTATFGDDEATKSIATTLYSIQAQRSALTGIEHVLRVERGLAVPTPERERLATWVESLPNGDERVALRLELEDPNRNFMPDRDGVLTRKYFEYEPAEDGTYVDRSDPAHPVTAAASFEPRPLSPYEYHVGGVPLFERNFEVVGMSDAKYMGFMFLAILVLLVLVFRNVVGVVAPITVVFGSIAAMVGVSFAIGDLFNNMTIIAPNMLTAVSIADSVHLVAAWMLLRSKYPDKRSLIIAVVQRNALPVFLTSVTTAVGFYSLTISEMVPVSMFGYTAGLGTIIAYFASMTLVPAILSLAPHHAGRSGVERAAKPSRFLGWEQALTSFVIHRRAAILACSIALLVVGIFGLTKLTIDSDFRAMFPDDNPVISDFNWIEARMGGVGDLEIVFEGLEPESGAFETDRRERLAELRLRVAGRDEGFTDEFAALTPGELDELERLERASEAWSATRVAVSGRFLEQADAFEARLREEMAKPESPLSVVTDFVSPLDVLRRMHQVQNENRAEFYRVPVEADVPAALRATRLSYDEWSEEWLLVPAQDASTLAAQYYLQYENGARPGENLATQVSMDRRQFRLQGRIKQALSQTMVDASHLIRDIAQNEFPELGARVSMADGSSSGAPPAGVDLEHAPALKVSGKMLLFARTTKIFTLGFMKSMALALTIITLLIAVIFRSIRIALVSLIPNVVPIVLPLSVFGLIGLPLDAPAIFVSSVALGVGVDDTIHFFTKFMHARRLGYTVEHAVRYVYETTGTAITLTSLILVLGFGTLVMSDFSPNFMMGTLAAAMIAIAWVADLLVTPAVLSFVYADELPSPAAVPVPARSAGARVEVDHAPAV